MIERLKVIMEKEGLNPSQLADKLHIQRSGLSHILSGRNNPSLDFVKKVLTEFPQYGTEWFIFGDTNVNNEIYKSEQSDALYLFNDLPHSTENASTKPAKRQSAFDPQSPENKRIPNQLRNDAFSARNSEKTALKKLVKVIMVYDNHTFEELKAE